MKTLITSSLHLLITSFLLAQAPQGIPYQAVLRNADGTVMASSAANMVFMIHDGSATGTVVYQESHTLTSNAQGLVTCVVGNGVVSQGNFANINWGSGAKFLHVMMGTTDLGTQQMLSVPYALYSNGVRMRASATGDTLTIGGSSVIVPGISSANPTNNGGLGSQVLVGNTTCANEYISVTGCGGQTSLTYDGRTYDLVEIGGQCWFADNLATDQYRNGDLIPTGLDNTAWQNTTTGAYAIYNNDPANDVTYGKLYNWYTTVDTRGLCPTGWHVPSDCEWEYIIYQIGGYNNSGNKLKSISGWYQNGIDLYGFNAKPGSCFYLDLGVGSGTYYFGGNSPIGSSAFWWSKTSLNQANAGLRCISAAMGNQDISSLFLSNNKTNGFSIRCLRD